MNSKAYSARNVNRVCLDTLLTGRDGQDLWVGVDIGKYHLQLVLHWGPGRFERPWKIQNPGDIGLLITLLTRLAKGRKLLLAMEPSGTYGDVLRQAATDANLAIHRISPKAAHDYAEIFDGVPSQHDGKDAAVLAELARLGKSVPWPWTTASDARQQIDYWVDRMDTQRRLLQIFTGRLEGALARHWPEVLRQLKLTSPTLLSAVAQYGGPAALAADAQAAAKLAAWGRHPLKRQLIDNIIDAAKNSLGVRTTPMDCQRLRDLATDAQAARAQQKQAAKHLVRLCNDDPAITPLADAVGAATAAVLTVHLGDARDYHCAAAYVKAMGLNLTERSSGIHKGKLKISKRGSGVVRYWMYLAALRLIKKNSPVRPWYLRKKQRDAQAAGRALVGIMRRLGLALYNVATRGEAFDAGRLFPGKATRARNKTTGASNQPMMVKTTIGKGGRMN
jgi:transposase